jgi:glycosyltransferase involved in cell wall biosynthesis
MKPLISILIPAFNAQEWIADTLRSAIAQTWNRKEIIVVDDGSTDQTVDIARRFESGSVKVVTQDNRGAPAARNAALAFSQGDYIQYLDADDLLALDKISRQVDCLVACGGTCRTLVSCSWGKFFYRVSHAKFVPTTLWCDLSPVEWLTRKLEEGSCMVPSCWLVSRRLTEAAGPWDTTLLYDDDGEYFSRVLLASDGVRFVPEAKVYYRFSGPGSFGYLGNSEMKRNSMWRSIQRHIEYVRTLEDSRRTRFACVKYLQRYVTEFYPNRPDVVKQARVMARHLGGRLTPPRLFWRIPLLGETQVPYSWIKAAFGWRAAKRARLYLPALIWGTVRGCDKVLYRIENRGAAPLRNLSTSTRMGKRSVLQAH